MSTRFAIAEKILQKHYRDQEIIAVNFEVVEDKYFDDDGCKWEDVKGPDGTISKVCQKKDCKYECISFTVTVKKDGTTIIGHHCICNTPS